MGTRRTLLGLGGAAALLMIFGFQAVEKRAAAEDPLIAGFKKTTVASVADAVDQVVGKRGFLSHEMRPRVPGQVVGRALTVLIKPAPPEKATPTLSTKHSVGLIDGAKPGEVAVIVIEDGLDVAGIGGLMATAAKRKIGHKTLSGAARYALEQWITGN